MKRWLAISRRIDAASDWLGKVISWLVVVMVLVGAFNAVARYLGRFLGTSLSSNFYLELQWYLFSLLFLLGAGYTLRRNGHVRVDVLSNRLSARGRAWVNILGTVLFLIPFSLFVLWVSWPSVRNAWSIREVSPDPGGLPRYPLKAVILACFALLVLQGVSELVKEIARLKGAAADPAGASQPPRPPPPPPEGMV